MRISIRKLTLLGLCLCVIVFFVCFFILQHGLLDAAFLDLERTSVHQDVQRAANAVRDELQKLDDTVVDWALWDDTFDFMQTQSQAFIDRNLNERSVSALRLAVLVFLNNDGTVLWGQGRDAAGNYGASLPDGLLDQLGPATKALQAATSEERSKGLVRLPEGLMLLASCPILDSDGRGPKRGTLVMGRLLDQGLAEDLADRVRLNVAFEPADTPLPADLEGGGPATTSEGITVIPASADMVAGLTCLAGLDGQLVLRLIVREPRTIISRGDAVVNRTGLVLAAGGLLLLAMVVWVVERRVLARLADLTRQVDGLAVGEAGLGRVVLSGDDELGRLARGINTMMAAVEGSRQALAASEAQLRRHRDHLEQLVTERTAALEEEIQARKRAQEALSEAKTMAENANRAKSAFLANMSHEIRTPLNGVLGMLQILENSSLDTEQRDCLETAVQAAERLTGLLSDILDLSRVEAGKLALHEEVFTLSTLQQSVLGLFRTSAKAKGLALTFTLAEGLPPVVRGDESRLRQILFNLVGNAIKFTAKGRVEVTFTPLADPGPDMARLLICVADTGIGIADAALDNIFDPFIQEERAYTRQHQGAGLGLAIVRRLVALMNGTLAVDNGGEDGGGTTFYISLPLARASCDLPPDLPASTDRPGPARRQARVLVVEDDPASLDLACRWLVESGHLPTDATNGEDALRLLGERPFDLVLLDVQLPRTSGLEVVRRLRAATDLAGDNARIPVVAMTAYAMAGDKDVFLKAGMTAYLSKPLDLTALGALIDRLLAAGPTAAGG